jgi:hypothetical protein
MTPHHGARADGTFCLAIRFHAPDVELSTQNAKSTMSETPLANVYVSGRFAGSILLRDSGFEAIDARDCAIGMFASQREAAAALQEFDAAGVDMKSATVAQTAPSEPVFAKA